MQTFTRIEGMHDTAAPSAADEGLFDVAAEQAGYFTSAQARALGYDWPQLTYHARAGTFVHLRRGLYRLRYYPASPREEVMAAWLAAGKDSAVVSHESALDLLDLSDVVPDAVHLLVPRTRRYLSSRAGIIIHTTTRPLRACDIETRSGIKLTAPLRTILDVAETGTGSEQVILAIRQARRRGWIVGLTLAAEATERGTRVADLIARGLRDR
jgi:predicted transcriptional regulator of viral defense system